MLECTEIQQVASRAAAGLKAHAKNSLRLSSPLAKDVWLVIFRKTAAPFARLVPVATQHRFRYGIARGGAAGVRAEQVTTRSSLIVQVGEQFEG